MPTPQFSLSEDASYRVFGKAVTAPLGGSVLRRRCCKIFSVVYHLLLAVTDVRRVVRERDGRVDGWRNCLERRERRAVWRLAESMLGPLFGLLCAPILSLLRTSKVLLFQLNWVALD